MFDQASSPQLHISVKPDTHTSKPTTNHIALTNSITYASKKSNSNQPKAAISDLIVAQLTTIITNLASNNMKIKDALISLLTILPLLLNL
jgi:hypothetical protein